VALMTYLKKTNDTTNTKRYPPRFGPDKMTT
jgi:hypothetical protein